ncbi:MAG: ABC transporter substrate-binding protein [Provencibacterium sp.]|jgi:D-methionine transport system substrate-binding protein|nr:ABC transporter substrate-binding protein [Provencibacterium sp.]
MKKNKTALLALSLAAALFAGCSAGGAPQAASSGDGAPAAVTLKVGASPTPHAEILTEAAKELASQGITLDIVEFTDYVQPNLALDSGELDANFFQHGPYLDQFNADRGTKLVSVGTVHYEPLGLYAGKSASVKDLPDGASIAVPNDTTNEARALLLLQSEGLLTLKEGAGVNATQTDIAENPKGLKIQEIAPEQAARSLQDVDLAVINGNYAILGGLNIADALAQEAADSLAAETYANVLAVREGDEARPEIAALLKALQGDAVKTFIENSYAGAVVPKS